MPSVIMNDVEIEAKIGERLLNVARRNAAHIGFVCDGNGICQTCKLRVLAGAEQLSPPNQAERAWIPARGLAEGQRLACQAVLRAPGTVIVLTNAEELRRQTIHALRPTDYAAPGERAEPLLANLARQSADQLALYPWNLLATLGRVGIGRFFFPIRNFDRWVDDASRIAQRMSGSTVAARGPSLAAVARAAQRADADPTTPGADFVDEAALIERARQNAQARSEAAVLEAARDVRRARAERVRARVRA